MDTFHKKIFLTSDSLYSIHGSFEKVEVNSSLTRNLTSPLFVYVWIMFWLSVKAREIFTPHRMASSAAFLRSPSLLFANVTYYKDPINTALSFLFSMNLISIFLRPIYFTFFRLYFYFLAKLI